MNLRCIPLVAEDQDEPNPEALAIRWMQTICGALDVLHSNGLTHGDVSPRNLIVSGTSLVLTDYDFVTRIDQAPIAGGTISTAGSVSETWRSCGDLRYVRKCFVFKDFPVSCFVVRSQEDHVFCVVLRPEDAGSFESKVQDATNRAFDDAAAIGQ